VKGQILDLRFEQALPERILNRGVWLLPLDRHRARFGATYERGERDTATTPEARAGLLERLAAAGIRDGYEVLAQRAGVRPGTVDRMPVVGLHPRQPALGMFNGFGSKGVIMMPFFARAFADCLCEGRPLPAAVDLQRFWSADD
jgi:glycine/D-amino acid oxidase-like deaminating enzyme